MVALIQKLLLVTVSKSIYQQVLLVNSFDVSLDAGNASGGTTDELDLNSSGDTLTVDGISYLHLVIRQLFSLVTA